MRLPTMLTTLCLAVWLGTAVAARAQDQHKGQHIRSPAQRVTLVELYTSEGCSSCPPADRWMSELKTDPRLWNTLVPVAFHVDYWDYIGWPDRFATAAYSDRHRDYQRYAGLRSVYTPGFLVQGEEWRAWFRSPKLNLDKAPPAGVISIDVAADGKHVEGSYTPPSAPSLPLELHVAVLGFDLKTAVKAGENHGRELHHDFVVLGHRRMAMQASGSRFVASGTLPDLSAAAPRQALAAWVSRKGNPTPLQAAGDWWKHPVPAR